MTAVQETTNATSKSFLLDDGQLQALEHKGGRTAKPGAYQAEVKEAAESGKAMGIAVTATVKGAWIMAQLRKSAKQLGYKIKVWDRSESVENPFIGFQVTGKETTTDATSDASTPAVTPDATPDASTPAKSGK